MQLKVPSLLLIFVICNIGIVAASSDNTVPANVVPANVVPANATILNNLPSEKTVIDVLNNSTAHNYSEIENMIVKNNWHGDRYNLTFEKIYDNKGVVVKSTDDITMDVVYINDLTGTGGYGRIGILAKPDGLYRITPEPFAIGKSVTIESLNNSSKVVTTPVNTAQITWSPYRNKNSQEIQPIENNPRPTPKPVLNETMNITKPIENNPHPTPKPVLNETMNITN